MNNSIRAINVLRDIVQKSPVEVRGYKYNKDEALVVWFETEISNEFIEEMNTNPLYIEEDVDFVREDKHTIWATF